MKKHQKIYTFTEKLEQNKYTESKKSYWLIKVSQRFIIWYSISIKVTWPTHSGFAKNFHIILTIMYWNYFKYNDLTHTSNVNKVPAKEHHIFHSWAADEILVWKILFFQTLSISPRNIALLLKTKRWKKLFDFF